MIGENTEEKRHVGVKIPRARLTQRDAHLIYVWLEERREERMSLGEIARRLHSEGVVKFIPNTGSVSRIARDIGYEVARGMGGNSTKISDFRKQISLQALRLDAQNDEIISLREAMDFMEKKYSTLSRIMEMMPGFSDSFTRQVEFDAREECA